MINNTKYKLLVGEEAESSTAVRVEVALGDGAGYFIRKCKMSV